MILQRQRVPVLDVDATPLTVPELTGVLQPVRGRRHHAHGRGTQPAQRHTVPLRPGLPCVLRSKRCGAHRRRAGADALGPRQPGARQGEGPVMDYRLGSTDWIPALADVEGLERIAVIGAGRRGELPGRRQARGPAPAGPGRRDCPGRAGTRNSRSRPSRGSRSSGRSWCCSGWVCRCRSTFSRAGCRRCPRPSTVPSAARSSRLRESRKLAPRWLGRLGLEWAWRLALHPRRVAYRVFGEPVAARRAADPAPATARALELLVLQGTEALAAQTGGKSAEPVGQPAEIAARRK